MENQESQQAAVSVTEFNEMKNELRNLTQLITVMMGRFENQTPPPAAQDAGSPQGTPLNEVPNLQTQSVPVPSVQINIPQPSPFQSDNHEEEEIPAAIDKETKDKVEELERQLKQIKGTDSLGSVNFSDLCIHPGLKFPTKFKCPDFEKYNGKSCPYAHLKVYGVAMAQYGDNDKLLVQTFPRSLTGAALTWFTRLDIAKIKKWIDLAHLFVDQYKFNSEIAPDREQLQRMTKKPSESFREYAQRWRQTASQVQPALTEKENVTIFMSTLSSTYYDRLIGHAGASFANLVQTGERIEDGLKTGKIKDYQTLFEQSSHGIGGSMKKNFSAPRTEDSKQEVHTIGSHASQHEQSAVYPAPVYHISAPSSPYHAMYHHQPIYNPQRPCSSNRPHNQRQQNRQQGNPQRSSNKVVRDFTPLSEPLSEIYPKLLSSNLITRIQPKPSTSPSPKDHDQSVRCAYHMDAPGHDINSCWAFKHKVQDLIDSGAIAITPPAQSVSQNPLPLDDPTGPAV